MGSVEKLHPGSGVVLETFETFSAAARSLSSVSRSEQKSLGAKLTKHIRMQPNEPFMGFLFRYKQCTPLMEKLCPTSGDVLENFFSVNAAAKSVDSYDKRLQQHMESEPNEPFFGFVFRFK